MSDTGTEQRKQVILFCFCCRCCCFFKLIYYTKICQSSDVSDIVVTKDTQNKGICEWTSGAVWLQIYLALNKADTEL